METLDPITLTYYTPELKDQLKFLAKQEFKIVYQKYRILLNYLLFVTLSVIGLIMFSNADSFVSLKAGAIVLVAIFWLVSFLLLIPVLIKGLKRTNWIKKRLKKASQDNLEYQFAFDHQEIQFIADSFNTKLKWDYFKYYAINKDSIFLFPEHNIYEAIFYSKEELGSENYQRLNQIASTNLLPLNLSPKRV